MNLTDIPFDQRQDLLSAALRYAAVADWFEAHPCRWHKHLTVAQAMEHFNGAEAQLRATCARVLHNENDRTFLLDAVGVPMAARSAHKKPQEGVRP